INIFTKFSPYSLTMSDHSVFNDLRLEGQFCDAVIKVEDVEFEIHKVILCKCSPYFLALFQRWSSSDKKVFVIPGMSPDMMRLIIDFAYTGSVSVTEENVQELLMAADQLNVMDIVQSCCDFLGEQLRADNCIGIFHLTDIILSAELQHRAYRYMADHFEEVAYHDEFLQLPLQQLIDILERDDLNVRNESVAFEAVLRWIDHVPGERKAHVAVLLSKVRLALTSMDYMRLKVLPNELVKTNTECATMIRDALKAISHIRTSNFSVAQLSNPLARPRLPDAILLAIGGWSGSDPTNGIEAYDVRANYWINVTNNCERPRAYHGTAILNGSLYCIGGFDRAEHFNSMRRFDLSTCVWHEAASMCHRRCYVSVTVLDECIYALGGFDGRTRLSTAERYRPEANQWSLISPMQEQRSDASSTTLHNRVVSTHETVTHQLVWHEVSPMLTPRSNFGIEVLDDRLFVVGGFNGFTTSFKVECYDATTDEWTEACDMNIFRSALSCCVVSRLPNMAEYVVSRDALPFLNEDANSDKQS
uniref:Kelch like family member 10 n=1 Tax=Cyclopterus lumpus TaxID=8103 RepID=A0A8C3G515_CYCLU